MNERVPRTFTEPAAERHERSMTEEETLSFLRERGVEPLRDWKQNQPLLYVMEEVTRADDGPFRTMAPYDRPSIARLDSPTFLDFQQVRGSDGREVYALGNEEGGQVDYYAIDPDTKEVRIVRTTNSVMTQDRPYNVRKDTLFVAADDVFPKSSAKE